MKVLQPKGWAPPRGYANGVAASGTMGFVAVGFRPEHIVRMTWYVTDKRDYLARGREIGAVYREVIGHYGVAMTAVEVNALMEDRAQVEIEVTAVVPG